MAAGTKQLRVRRINHTINFGVSCLTTPIASRSLFRKTSEPPTQIPLFDLPNPTQTPEIKSHQAGGAPSSTRLTALPRQKWECDNANHPPRPRRTHASRYLPTIVVPGGARSCRGGKHDRFNPRSSHIPHQVPIYSSLFGGGYPPPAPPLLPFANPIHFVYFGETA